MLCSLADSSLFMFADSASSSFMRKSRFSKSVLSDWTFKEPKFKINLQNIDSVYLSNLKDDTPATLH